MSTRLLDRQVSLLDYLTSGDAVFGGSAASPSVPPCREWIGIAPPRGVLFASRSVWRRSLRCFRGRSRCWGPSRRDRAGVCRGLPTGRHQSRRECAPVLRFSLRALAARAAGASVSARRRGLRTSLARVRVDVEGGESDPATDASAPRAASAAALALFSCAAATISDRSSKRARKNALRLSVTLRS